MICVWWNSLIDTENRVLWPSPKLIIRLNELKIPWTCSSSQSSQLCEASKIDQKLLITVRKLYIYELPPLPPHGRYSRQISSLLWAFLNNELAVTISCVTHPLSDKRSEHSSPLKKLQRQSLLWVEKWRRERDSKTKLFARDVKTFLRFFFVLFKPSKHHQMKI